MTARRHIPIGSDVELDALIEEESGGGGAGGVRLLDLGIVTVDDVSDDVVTVYEPDVDAQVIDVRLTEFTYLNDGNSFFLGIFSGTRIGPIACIANDAGNTRDLPNQQIAGVSEMQIGAAIDDPATQVRVTATDPLVVGLTAHDSGALPATSWATLTDVLGSAISSCVIGAGHLWQCDGDGTTGASAPDFAGNIGGSVSDGDTSWTDRGEIPTEGQTRILILVATPAAP